jgi:MFS family permease
VNPEKQRFVFYTIVIAQFCGTSLWFAGNAVLPQLQLLYHWPASALAYLTSATLLGFITGTLVFAIAGVADRYSPSKVFLMSCVIGSLVNLAALTDLSSYSVVLITRLLVGFFLAGIYPVGMKIASDWKAEGLGHWLGSLVGALVAGTAFPQVLLLIPQIAKPELLLIVISVISIMGGIAVGFFVENGPFRKAASAFSTADIHRVFSDHQFKRAAFGYFGHMWELYAFWAFVPWIVSSYMEIHAIDIDPPLLSFLIIGSGAAGCIAGGRWSVKTGSARVAFYALAGSAACCLLSPFLWEFPPWLFIFFMTFWGITVITDSPQFSALVAKNAQPQLRGTAITIVTCLGFSITIASIQLLNYFRVVFAKEFLFLLLLPGPLAGIFFLSGSFIHQSMASSQITSNKKL